MIEDSRCFQVGDSVSAFIRLSGILSDVDNCYRSWVCQNNGGRPPFITEAGECYFEPDHAYHFHQQNNLVLYQIFLNSTRSWLYNCVNLATLRMSNPKMNSHVKTLNEM